VLLLSGCVQEMADQPRIEPLEGSTFFSDGLGAREQVSGTIARGQIIEQSAVTTGLEHGQPAQALPVPLTHELLERGRERFGIYCVHCHGPAGHGDGMVVQRGFPQPPAYFIERLRNAPDGHIFTVITDGLGRMPKFGARIEPHDRWAIVAYVRALQLSQHADVSTLPHDVRQRLPGETP
jgi:mono/diheme cytochrome c family protein